MGTILSMELCNVDMINMQVIEIMTRSCHYNFKVLKAGLTNLDLKVVNSEVKCHVGQAKKENRLDENRNQMIEPLSSQYNLHL